MSASDFLAGDGALASHLGGFQPRTQQQEMADRIESIIDASGVLVVEAGTGVGKTFAYLVPAIESGKRVIIATGTKNLQDQLFHNDLPVIRKAMSLPVTVSLLKGRSNYLCQHRLEMHINAGSANNRHLHELEIIHDWAGRTTSGDIAEVDDIEEGSMVWSLATSTIENCLGQECEYYDDCYVLQARRKAQSADIVVINHHLLFADLSLKERGFGDILPGADVFIIDEAHQLPEIAGDFFGFSLTSRQLYNLASDARTEHLKESGSLHELPPELDKLEQSIADLRLSMGQTGQRFSWDELQTVARNFPDYLQVLQLNLQSVTDWLAQAAERSKGLDNCYRRSLGLLQHLQSFGSNTDDEDDELFDHVRWADTSRRGFGLHSTPLNIDEIFQAHMSDLQASWVFTSATLAVGDNFSHFSTRLGLKEPQTLLLGSPFDYRNNGLKYLPKGLPEPSDPSYTREVCAQSIPVIEAAGGRTFMLFTSHRALQEAAQFMRDHIDYPILVQGQAPKQRLLSDFRRHGNALLLGTASFWEGVDVRGSALSCVIIDKLPFASPGDPVMQARLGALKKRGLNPFFDYQLPSAVVTLKQGVGRLIRDVTDTGILMLCDPRLLSKSYGKVFLRSLPEMPVTRELDDVVNFFAERETA